MRKGKSEGSPVTWRADTDGEYRQLYSILTSALNWGEWPSPRPGHLCPREKAPVPLQRDQVGPRDRTDGLGEDKISYPTRVGTRTVQSVARYFTDCVLLAHVYNSTAHMHVFVKSDVLVTLTRFCRLLPPGMWCRIFG